MATRGGSRTSEYFQFYSSFRKGITLVEIMVAMSLLSIGVLGMIGSFTYLNKGLQCTKGRTLANNLAQEKIELLKNYSYYRVLVTTKTTTDSNFDPPIEYDAYPNGMEEIGAGGINFKRYVFIQKIAEDGSGNLKYFDYHNPDTGLKEIEVHVVWQEGDDWKKLKLTNIRENPDRSYLSASFTGTIEDDDFPANEIEDVTVKVIENPARSAETDASGNYTFAIEPGSYTLRASKDGYFPALSAYQSIESGETTVDFTLVKMSTGTISGRAYKNDHLVISTIVGSTEDAGCFQEWIEVYNPTTWTWTMATGLNAGVIGVAYASGPSGPEVVIPLAYSTLTLAPQHYYLIANTANITADGSIVSADAVYSGAGCQNIININTDPDNDAAGMGLGWLGPPTVGFDAIGWKTGGVQPYLKEGTPLDETIGLQANEMYVRKTGPGGLTPGDARTYDIDNNINEFAVYPAVVAPKNSSDSEVPVTGSAAVGAVVYANDGMSNSVVVSTEGKFELINVATGSWTVYISSDDAFISSGTFGGLVNGFSDSMEVILDSQTTMGYITGLVSDGGGPLTGIKVYAAGCINPVSTVNGSYTLALEPDTVVVTANYNYDNTSYIEVSSVGVVVEQGAITTGVNFVLSEGGNIEGRVVTTGAGDPLPNTPIVAYKSGIAQGDGITDGDGYFEIIGISSGSYLVEAMLEAGESSSPPAISTTVALSDDLFIGTFTVSGAMGYIIGDVTTGSGADEEIIDTGVLIYASTDTIASTPPTLNSALRSGNVIYYAASSNFKGTYTLPVRGGYTYNIYAWYTTWSGDTPTVNREEYDGVDAVTIAAGETVERDFNW
ncbi:MAG: carboxypeptidase regulatory-like domain-containing protein [Elusimicrobiota bacterium]|nr:carboxypeptidase regulatory-like domain-containing protein [Elusimicrobiota bacterium]